MKIASESGDAGPRGRAVSVFWGRQKLGCRHADVFRVDYAFQSLAVRGRGEGGEKAGVHAHTTPRVRLPSLSTRELMVVPGGEGRSRGKVLSNVRNLIMFIA